MVNVSVTGPGSTISAGATEKLISRMCRSGGSVASPPSARATGMAKPPAHTNARARAASSAANLRMRGQTSFEKQGTGHTAPFYYSHVPPVCQAFFTA